MIIKKKKKKNIVEKIFSFKLFAIVGVFVIFFLGLNLGKEFYRKYQIQKEIDSLKGDISSLEKNNYKMSQLIEYYNTDEFKEAEIRKKLGVKKEGENVVVVREAFADSNSDIIEKEIDNNKNLPNYRKWWNYFFATKK